MANTNPLGMRHGDGEGAVGNTRSPSDADSKLRPEATACAQGLTSKDILDAIPHSIAVLDPQGTALYANQGFLDYTGLSLEEIMAPTLRARVFHPDDIARVQQARAEGLSRGLPFENEQRAMGKDGKYRWFLIRWEPARTGWPKRASFPGRIVRNGSHTARCLQEMQGAGWKGLIQSGSAISCAISAWVPPRMRPVGARWERL